MSESEQSDISFEEALQEAGIELEAEQASQIKDYCHLLWEYNKKMNLTRHTTYRRFVERDVLDSQMLASVLDDGDSVLDVGTGGGVPGIILSILKPGLNVTLLEPVGKKANAVNDMVGELNVPCSVYRDVVQEHLLGNSYNVVTARAVGSVTKIMTWTKGLWGQFDKMVLIKGPKWKEECADAKSNGLTRMVDIKKLVSYPMPGTESESHIIEIGKKNNAS